MHRMHRAINGRMLPWLAVIVLAAAVPASAAITGITPTGGGSSIAMSNRATFW